MQTFVELPPLPQSRHRDEHGEIVPHRRIGFTLPGGGAVVWLQPAGQDASFYGVGANTEEEMDAIRRLGYDQWVWEGETLPVSDIGGDERVGVVGEFPLGVLALVNHTFKGLAHVFEIEPELEDDQDTEGYVAAQEGQHV